MATYVATDLHGQYDLWKAIQSYLKEDDKLFFLGDAIDRGPRGWDILVEMLDDKRVEFIKGNHEDIMLSVLNGPTTSYKSWLKHWRKNGGTQTMENMKTVPFEQRKKYLDKLEECPSFITFENTQGKKICLNHSGWVPTEDECNIMNDNDIEYNFLWNREHFDLPLPNLFKDYYIIHGHTPTTYINKTLKEIKPLSYCNGHKIDLDIASFVTNEIALFNLDEWKIETILTTGENENEYINK